MGGDARFDSIAVVDWSAAAVPRRGADSIWVAVADDDGCTVDNPPTRHAALASIEALARPGRRTLVGVDFSLGFPRDTARAVGVRGDAWAGTWRLLADEITDDDRNANNRFEVAARLNASFAGGAGPFWGCPPASATPALTGTKPPARVGWPAEWRHVEIELRRSGRRPFAAWQLLGAGSVGSQSLVGIAALERLRRRLGSRMAVWPFTAGLGAPAGDAQLVVAEVWPSLWPGEVPVGQIKDAWQARSTAERILAADRRGELDRWFSPDVPDDALADVVGEEGWVLGVGVGH